MNQPLGLYCNSKRSMRVIPAPNQPISHIVDASLSTLRNGIFSGCISERKNEPVTQSCSQKPAEVRRCAVATLSLQGWYCPPTPWVYLTWAQSLWSYQLTRSKMWIFSALRVTALRRPAGSSTLRGRPGQRNIHTFCVSVKPPGGTTGSPCDLI
jgi:hypothetical protein